MSRKSLKKKNSKILRLKILLEDKEVAEELLKQSKGGSGKYKSTLIDLVISKTQINKNYYYPSIVNCIISESLIKNKIIHNTTWENYI